MKKIRFALINSYGHADRFADKLIEAGCELTLNYDDDKEAGAKIAEHYGCRFEPDIEKAVNDPEVDAVVIVSKITDRANHVILAATAGKHIYVEKPVFMWDADAEKARRIVREKGLKFIVSDPVVKIIRQMFLAKQIVESGKLGEVYTVRTRSAFKLIEDPLYDELTRGGRGIYMNGITPHAVCMLHFFLGYTDKAKAVMTHKLGTYAEDNVVGVYEYGNGAIGICESDVFSDRRQDGFAISGTEGSIFAVEDQFLVRYKDEKFSEIPESEWPDYPIYPLNYLIKCIDEDVEPDYLGIDFAVEQCRMINAAYESCSDSDASR